MSNPGEIELRRCNVLGLEPYPNNIERRYWWRISFVISLLPTNFGREQVHLPRSEVRRLPHVAESIFCPAVISSVVPVPPLIWGLREPAPGPAMVGVPSAAPRLWPAIRVGD